MADCINLKSRYGDRFRIASEESSAAERGGNARNNDPWLRTIPCANGHIYPYGGEMLGASTDRRGPISKALSLLPCVRVVQDADDGINAIFPVDSFDTVAAVMKPRRRRRLSPEQIARSTERLRKYQFPAAAQNAPAEQTRVPRAQPDSRAA